MAMNENEYCLQNLPSDLVSAVKFHPSSSRFLLVSSWDTAVRLYDLSQNTVCSQYSHPTPVLDCCFKDTANSWSGCLAGYVKAFDFNTNSESIIGYHSAAVKCVEYCADLNLLITGSWDCTIRLWDARTMACQGILAQPNKVYTMALCGTKLIVGTAGRNVIIWDLQYMGHVLQHRESSLKYQTRCIRGFPNQQGYAISSIEGRVAVEYLDQSPDVQKQKFAFKCHRIKDNDNVELIYPVNAIAFHSCNYVFATGGSDRIVNIWDSLNKKRLVQFPRYKTHISSLAFSPDGNNIAIASSYIYAEDESQIPPEIYIRNLKTLQKNTHN